MKRAITLWRVGLGSDCGTPVTSFNAKAIFIARLMLAMLMLAMAPLAFADCKVGTQVDPNVLIPGLDPPMPADKTLCRIFGPVAPVPSLSYALAADAPESPPCGTMAAADPQIQQYKDALSGTGVVLLTKVGGPYATFAGVLFVLAGTAIPNNKHSREVTCGYSYVVLSPEYKLMHIAAFYGNDNQAPTTHAVDENSFYKNDAGEEGPFRVEKTQPHGMPDGKIAYGIVFKNLATESIHYRHIIVMVDVAE